MNDFSLQNYEKKVVCPRFTCKISIISISISAIYHNGDSIRKLFGLFLLNFESDLCLIRNNQKFEKSGQNIGIKFENRYFD